MLDGLLDAICRSQLTIGTQMSMDSISAENISSTLVDISNSWAGTPGIDPSKVPQDANGLPLSGTNYSTAEIQAMVSYIAGQEQGATGDTLTQLQAKSSDWTNTGSAMGNVADLQKAPFNTMQQGETSQIQQDQSGVSASSQLASPIADFAGIVASLVPNIS